MATKRATEIKVGIVSVLAVILIIIGITLGRGVHVTVSQKTIKMRFPHSGSIKMTEPVLVNGVRRGMVESIKNDNRG